MSIFAVVNKKKTLQSYYSLYKKGLDGKTLLLKCRFIHEGFFIHYLVFKEKNIHCIHGFS